MYSLIDLKSDHTGVQEITLDTRKIGDDQGVTGIDMEADGAQRNGCPGA